MIQLSYKEDYIFTKLKVVKIAPNPNNVLTV